MRRKQVKVVIITLKSIVFLGLGFLLALRWFSFFETDYVLEGQEQLHGTFHTFYDDGVVKSVEHFNHGKKQGLNINYYPSACLKSTRQYENGKLHGFSYFFSEREDTVYYEEYRENQLLSKVILNDSLYQFELNNLDYGMMLFNNNCRMCHELKENNLAAKAVMLADTTDSLWIKPNYFDVFHENLVFYDSIKTLSDSINVLLGNKPLQPTQKELNILYNVFQSELSRPRIKYLRVNNLNKKNKVS